MKQQLYVDMDGVLADFDLGYEQAFGIRASKANDNADWKLVRAHEGFYLNLPPMPDFEELWAFIQPLNPIVLTGVPKSVPEATANKTAWVRKYLGDTEVRCCLAKEKCLHARPGDILIDDWEKHKAPWVQAGGIWVTHTSAANTIEILKTMEW